MKKLYLSLASVPMFAGFAVANAGETTPEPTPLDEPTTLDAATLDGITAAGSSCDGRDGGGDNFQNDQSLLEVSANVVPINVGGNQNNNANTGNQNDSGNQTFSVGW